MENIRFANQAHKDFFNEMLDRTGGRNDVYHRALFYTLGINDDTRKHINDLFDFQERGIKPEGMDEPWQTGGSSRISRLALNLWNGYTIDGHEELSTPYNLFDCSQATYMLEAVKIRYPECFRTHDINLDR